MSKALILASGSAARQKLLRQAGYDFDICPADIDEERVRKTHADKSLKEIALILAQEKASHVSAQNPEALVIGSDQICTLENEILSKAKNQEEAFEKLCKLSGQTHQLHTAVSLYENQKEIWSHCDSVSLRMKLLTQDQIQTYMDHAGDALKQCAGAYALEEVGVRLFEKVDGDYFSVLGLPLLPLIAALDERGYNL